VVGHLTDTVITTHDQDELRHIVLICLSLPCFNVYRDEFYGPDGVKYLPEWLGEDFTNVSVAY